MTDSDFNKFSTPQLLRGFHLGAKNSISQYEAAIQLANSGLHGLANSLLILSAEEAFKAYVLFAKTFNRSKHAGITRILNDHILKHKEAREVYKISKFSLTAMKYSIELLKKNKKRYKDFTQDEISLEAVRLSNEKTEHLKREVQPEVSQAELRWWKRANDQKKNGLYVDYDNLKWSSPSEITKSEFIESQKIVYNFIGPLFVLGNIPESYLGPMEKAFRAANII